MDMGTNEATVAVAEPNLRARVADVGRRVVQVAQDAQAVEEPSFEPGETTLQMRAVGKVKFR